MNEEEYRFNMNQLNVKIKLSQKAVTGAYEHDRYIDRSVNSIGVNKLKGSSSVSMNIGRKPSTDDDVVAVQEKLNEIRKSGAQKQRVLINLFIFELMTVKNNIKLLSKPDLKLVRHLPRFYFIILTRVQSIIVVSFAKCLFAISTSLGLVMFFSRHA